MPNMKHAQAIRILVALFAPLAIALISALVAKFLLYPTSVSRRQGPMEVDVLVAKIDAMHNYGATSMNNLFLGNGGAIVGILTFLGHMFSTDNEQRINRARVLTHGLLPSLTSFTAGLFCSAVLGFGWYHGMLADVRGYPGPRIIHVIDFATLAALLYFISGAVFGGLAFNSLAKNSSDA